MDPRTCQRPTKQQLLRQRTHCLQMLQPPLHPLATTAAGRAYYCAIGDQDRALLDDALALKYGEDWPEKRQGLTQAIEDYRAHGFCLSLGEWDRNINSAGVPIHLQDGTIMALTCSAPSYLVPADRLRDTIAHQLAMLAGDIESLGV